MPQKILVGRVDHFYDKVSVAAIILEQELSVGDRISIEKGDIVVEQVVKSMQIEHKDVKSASGGASVGIKTDQPVAHGSLVYKLVE